MQPSTFKLDIKTIYVELEIYTRRNYIMFYGWLLIEYSWRRCYVFLPQRTNKLELTAKSSLITFFGRMEKAGVEA